MEWTCVCSNGSCYHRQTVGGSGARRASRWARKRDSTSHQRSDRSTHCRWDRSRQCSTMQGSIATCGCCLDGAVGESSENCIRSRCCDRGHGEARDAACPPSASRTSAICRTSMSRTAAPPGRLHLLSIPSGSARSVRVLIALEMWRSWHLSVMPTGFVFEKDAALCAPDAICALITQRCVAPGSKGQAQRWFPRVALPEPLDAIDADAQDALVRRYELREGTVATLPTDVPDAWFEGAHSRHGSSTVRGRPRHAAQFARGLAAASRIGRSEWRCWFNLGWWIPTHLRFDEARHGLVVHLIAFTQERSTVVSHKHQAQQTRLDSQAPPATVRAL